MKRLAILTCRNAGDVCNGGGCMQAVNNRTGSFAQYEGEEIELAAFMRCNGCENVEDQGSFEKGIFHPLADDSGMQGKLDHLVRAGVDIVHFGVCVHNAKGALCPAMPEIVEALQAREINVVWGTH